MPNRPRRSTASSGGGHRANIDLSFLGKNTAELNPYETEGDVPYTYEGDPSTQIRSARPFVDKQNWISKAMGEANQADALNTEYQFKQLTTADQAAKQMALLRAKQEYDLIMEDVKLSNAEKEALVKQRFGIDTSKGIYSSDPNQPLSVDERAFRALSNRGTMANGLQKIDLDAMTTANSQSEAQAIAPFIASLKEREMLTKIEQNNPQIAQTLEEEKAKQAVFATQAAQNKLTQDRFVSGNNIFQIPPNGIGDVKVYSGPTTVDTMVPYKEGSLFGTKVKTNVPASVKLLPGVNATTATPILSPIQNYTDEMLAYREYLLQQRNSKNAVK